MKLKPNEMLSRTCPVCGKSRGNNCADHSACSRKAQADGVEENKRLRAKRKQMYKQASDSYKAPKSKKWWPD